MGVLGPIKLSDWRKYLKHKGCEYHSTNASHEHWTKQGLLRRITFQCTNKEVPIFIIGKCLQTMGETKEDLLESLNKSSKKTKT